MRADDVRSLIDFNYWANRRLADSAAEVSREQFEAPPTFSYRGMRATLVHILDVEWSWRLLLQGDQPDRREVTLTEADLPTLEAIVERWAADEREMRVWLSKLTDADLSRTVDLGDGDGYPLWYYLVHVMSHSEQQRRDVQLLLRSFGVEPPDLEFLWYADHIAGKNVS